MRSILLRVGVIGAIIIGAIILRPFLSGNAGNLQAGDCFDVPGGPEDTVDDIQHHPCTDAHGAEVFLVANYEPATDIHPTSADFEAFVAERCIPAFATYTGRTYESATDLEVEWFWPTAEGWADGQRRVICYAIPVDQATLTQSIKAAQ